MEPYDTYTSVVTAASVALLLITAGVAKQQLVWKLPKPLPVRRRDRKRKPVRAAPAIRGRRRAGVERLRVQRARASGRSFPDSDERGR